MNPRRLLASFVAFLAIAGLAAGLSLLSPAQKPEVSTVELPRTTRVTCLLPGDALIYALGRYRAVSADGDEILVAQDSRLEAGVGGPFIVTADSLAVAGVHTAGPVRTYAPCAPATASGAILVTDPADAELLITNSDANEAVVDLTLLGPTGEIPAVGARGIAVASGVTRRIALSVLAPDGPVGVSFAASQGRVAMAAVNVEGREARFVAPTRAATSHLIGGVPADSSTVQLIIANPFEERADITVSALGATSTYELAPTADLSVEPMSTVTVELGAALGGEASAIRVEATQAVAAAVQVTGLSGSPTTLVASEPAQELGATTLGGALQITNPGTEAVVVEVEAGDGADIDVAPGTTVVHLLPVAPQQLLRLEASGPVVASAATSEDTGALIIPLGATADPPRQPGSTALDPHLR